MSDTFTMPDELPPLNDTATPVEKAAAPVEPSPVAANPVAPETPPDSETKKKKEREELNLLSPPVLSFDTPPHNVQIDRPTTKPEPSVRRENLWLPAAPYASQGELLKSFPNMQDNRSSIDVHWASTFMSGMKTSPANGDLDKALSRDGSDWRQGITHNGDSIRSTIPRVNLPANTELTGEKAIQAAVRHMRLGDLFHAAMWESGFWVTFKPAPEAVWMDINRQLGMEVAGITRDTYGLLHSSSTSLATSTIIRAILPHVYATSVSLADMPVSDIPKYLSAQDEQDFIWGFIAANHPDGFGIERACITDPSKCRHVIKETIQVTELQVVDVSALSEKMRTHMHKRGPGSMKLQEVLSYQEELMARSECTREIKGSYGITASIRLRVPTSAAREQLSATYVAELQQNILQVVTSEAPPQARRQAYDEYHTATEMRLYHHYVTRIDVGGNAITDPSDIGRVLGEWSRDPQLRASFFEVMSEFLNASAVSAIGLEAAICPNCNGSHSRPDQKLRGKIDYVVLDVIQAFSRLAVYKNRLISAEA